MDFHRPDAVRILNFPHAGEYIAAAGRAILKGEATVQAGLESQLHALKHTGSGPVLAELHQQAVHHPDTPNLSKAVAYLEKREAMHQYPTFQAQGWPIADGAVESANKLVADARLKGSGMHWDRTNVNPMLALRNIACSDRWQDAWLQIEQTLRRQDRQPVLCYRTGRIVWRCLA